MITTLLRTPFDFFQRFLLNNKKGIAFLFCLSSLLSVQAQVANYTFSEASGQTYTPITGTVVTGMSGTFAAPPAVSIPIGFSFNFNGTDYTSAIVSDNGYITFGTGNPGTSTASLTNPTVNVNGVISAYGGVNLVNASSLTTYAPYSSLTSDVSYVTTGTLPNRIFIVQYRNLIRKGPTLGQIGLFNMQIKLYESSNVIETWYNTFDNTGVTVSTLNGQVGLRGLTTSDVNYRKAAAIWPATSAGTLIPYSGSEGIPYSSTIYNSSVTRFTWTPPCYAPTGLTATQVASSVVSWTAPSPAPSGYSYEVRTSGGFGSGATGLYASGSVTSPTTTFSLSGLTPGVTYTVYVRSSCGGTVQTTTIVPACSFATIPYTQNFESSAVPLIPACNSTQVLAGTAAISRDNTATPYYGFANKNLSTNGFLAMDSWYYTQQIYFPSAGSYRLSYKYGGSRELPQFTQKMKVAFGSNNLSTAMTTVLADHDNIKESPLTNVVNFQVSAAGYYYVGFDAYAAANNGVLQLDDIVIDYSTCFPPTSLVSAQVASNSAIISWTAPSPAPAGGYEYYISTSATTPFSTTIPTGSTAAGDVIANLSALNPLTTYYFWVRSSCGGGDVSQWSSVGSFTTLQEIIYCNPAPSSVDGSGITNVTCGSINNTTGAETNNYRDYSDQITNVAQTTTVSVAITFNTSVFDYNTKIWVDWNNDGDFYDSNENVYTGLSLSTSPNVLPATFVVPTTVTNGAIVTNTLGQHRMRIGGADIDTLTGTGNGQGPCYTGSWGTFEDYSIYVIVAPPALTISSNSVSLCSGESSPCVALTSPRTNFQVYTWSPSTGVSGNSACYVFNPTTTTTYTLTATQTSGNFSSNTTTYTVTVNPLPTPITITPASATICQNGAGRRLIASGGIVSGLTIFEENFNGATNTFTAVNNSTGGSTAVPAWTLHPSPWSRGGYQFRSNDNSQFYFSDSDGQTSSGITNTILTSPSFSLAGYTEASLSFWHYYRGWSSGTAMVQISTDGGLTWDVPQSTASGSPVPIPGTSWTTNTVGAANAFVNVTVDLSSYVGNANVQIRFNYNDAHWGWWWALDNVKVTGSAASSVVWSPITDLYTDLACTIPYTGTPLSTVYVRTAGAANLLYTASASTPIGCSTSTQVPITVNPITQGTTSGNQTYCSVPTDITISGNSGTVTAWQSSANATTWVGIASSASSTLTSAQIMTAMGTAQLKYFRAVMTYGTCSFYSTVITVSTSSTTWNGTTWSNGAPDATTIGKKVIIAGNLTVAADFSACALQINSGTVTVNPGVTLTVQNGVTVAAAASLIFENTASLVQVNSTANVGNITYKRITTPMLRYDYTYWSSPVQPQTLFALSPNTLSDKYFWWDTSIYNWNNIAAPAITLMNPGQGYIIRAPQTFNISGATATFATQFLGVPNNGDYPVSVTVNGANNLNLLGNPYPSAINADLFVSGNTPTFGAGTTLYFWTHNSPILNNVYAANDYAAYNYTGGTGTAAINTGINTNVPNGKIAAGQAFMIKGLASGTATFRNSMRVAGNNSQFFRLNSPNSQELEKNRLWLDFKNEQGAYKQALVGYIENASNAFDSGFDGEVLEAGNAVSFYSVMADKKLTIQGRALPFDMSDQIPLGYKTSIATTYAISLAQWDGLFTNQTVYLEDKVLNVIHNLSQGAYQFVTDAGTFDTRFVLRFTDAALGVHPAFSENAVIVYKHNQDVQVETVNETIQKVVIYDLRGAKIAELDHINATKAGVNLLNVAQQVLVVQVTNTQGATVVKKIVF